MKIIRNMLIISAVVFAAWMFFWAVFSPKKDVSQIIYETLKEQEKLADLTFKKVTFEEVSAGEKFWRLSAESAIVNKDRGVAALQGTEGTFYKKRKAALKFRSPAALWDMKKKEIYLDRPFGYDLAYEKYLPPANVSQRRNLLSIFNLPVKQNKETGYWFQAKNLSWKVSDQLLLCSGGIILNKGEITAYAESLNGDVEFKNVELKGSPRVVISPAQSFPITFESRVFEINSERDLLIARGNPLVTWREAKITSQTAQYLQPEKKLNFSGNVTIVYKDISAWGDSADYLTEEQRVILSGNARAVQGENNLSSDKVQVSLRDQKISLAGKSKVVITGEKARP